jgi:hypothetical protein
MICKECFALIPGFLDGELTEAQAAPLRRHLMDCPDCRKAASGEKAFKRWFDFEEPQVEVPPGFAARVARRAFAGDTGEGPVVTEREAPILNFVLRVTAVAAGLLLVLSAWMRSVQVPDGNAQAQPQPHSFEEIFEAMEKRQQAVSSEFAEEDSSPEERGETEDPSEGGER